MRYDTASSIYFWRSLMRTVFFVVSLATISLWGQDILPGLESPPVVIEESDRFTKEFIKVMVAVGIMVGALLFLSWSSKKILNTQIQQANEKCAIKITEKRSISTKTTVYQLDIEGRSVLLAESSNGVTLLHSTARRETFNLKDTQSS